MQRQREELSVVIYGSSLCLMALGAALSGHPNVSITQFPYQAPTISILLNDPAVVLYQSSRPPHRLQRFIQAGIILAEFDMVHSQLTLKDGRRPPIQHVVNDSTEVVTSLICIIR